MDKKFLNKVVDQIIRETKMVYPTMNYSGYVNFPFSKIYGTHDTLIKKNWTIGELDKFFSVSPSSPFIQHLKEIYGITQTDLTVFGGDSEVFYVWWKYIEVFKDKLKKGINIVDVYDPNIPNRWVGQIDESFKKESDISFLIKVVDQLISETEIDGNRAWGTWSLNNHLTPAFWKFLLYHCRSVYGLNTDELLWVEDYYRERLDSKLRNNLSESKEINLKDSKFLQKVLKYLIDNTIVGRYEKLPDIDFHYDGYIIVPIGSGFRFDIYNKTRQPNGNFTNEWWGEMKDVYSLKNEEVIPLLDEYNTYLWELVDKINSKEEINESTNNKKIFNKVLNLLGDPPYIYTLKSMGFSKNEIEEIISLKYGKNVRLRIGDTDLDGNYSVYVRQSVREPLYVETLTNNDQTINWEKWEWYEDGSLRRYQNSGDERRFKTKNGITVYDEHIEDYYPEELEDDFYVNQPNEFLINESVNSNFLNKLLDHIKSETKFEPRTKFIHNSERTIYAGNYVQLPFFPEDWYRELDDMYVTDFMDWIKTLGIHDTKEIGYLWNRYVEWVNKKCNE